MVSTVSTRGVKFKFAEGEKVLCYEPDPTKAKVLYDSKVLELNVSRDSRGRKVPEYLIHFFGWSSSWDRCVKEEFILPNTEENRVLQAKLAQEAAAYLKGKRKSKLPPIIKESLQKKESPEETKEPEAAMAKNEEAESSESCPESSDEEQHQRLPIDIKMPHPLKIKLVDDNFCILRQNKLIRLPSEISIVSILEDYVKHIARKLLSPNDTGSKAGTNIGMSISAIKSQLNFTKEAVDGIRLYFDFTLPHLLLYRQEKKQFYTQGCCCSPVKPKRPEVPKEENVASAEAEASTSSAPSTSGEQGKSANASASQAVTRGGLRNQSTSQKSPQKVEEQSTPGRKNTKGKEIGPPSKKLRALGSREGLRSRVRTRSIDDNISDVATPEISPEIHVQANAIPEPAASPPSPSRQTRRSILKDAAASQATPAPVVQVAKPSGSQKKNPSASASSSTPTFAASLITPLSVCVCPVSMASTSTGVPGTSGEKNEKKDETTEPRVMSPQSFLVAAFGRANIRTKPKKKEQTPESLLKEVLEWKMLPDYLYDYKPASPSLIYGGPHLLRLFVKLSELLYKSYIPTNKMGPLLELIDDFLQYLIGRKDELVNDDLYTTAPQDDFVQPPSSANSSRAI